MEYYDPIFTYLLYIYEILFIKLPAFTILLICCNGEHSIFLLPIFFATVIIGGAKELVFL